MTETNTNANLNPIEPGDAVARRPHRRRRRMRSALIAGACILAVGIAGTTTAVVLNTRPQHGPVTTAAPEPPAQAPAYTPLTAGQVAKLPAAVYNATIPGLIPATIANAPRTATSYELAQDVPVYGADQQTPVARLPHLNFLGQPTTATTIRTSGSWSLVLTPARQGKPSVNDGYAPAQTAGWVRTDQLGTGTPLTARVLISASKQTLTIRIPGQQDQVFKVGVGTDTAPTPTGVTGFIQARYLDPNQDAATHPINLTTLHSAAKDEPYGGKDGGLIGIHYNPDNTGAVSHGCIRLPIDALNAVTTLPLGTPITITT